MIKMSLNVSEENLGVRRRRLVSFLKKLLKMDTDTFTQDEIDLLIEKFSKIRFLSRKDSDRSGEEETANE